jgi:hypothetical protein
MSEAAPELPDRPVRSRDRVVDGRFATAYGEPLDRALDLATWSPLHRLAEIYERMEAEIAAAVAAERGLRGATRAEILPQLARRPGRPHGAGLRRVTPEQLYAVHAGVLFTGQVEACDGAALAHETLPLTIAQIGVCLVSYRGDLGTWAQRLFHRDLRLAGPPPLDEVKAVLGARRGRAGLDRARERDQLATLGRRGIQSFAERAVLVEQATAPWRMGHGQPAALEILAGSGSNEFLLRGLDLLERLICEHQRFVFVPSATPDRHLITIGDALDPLEFAIVDSMRERWQQIVDHGYYDAAFMPRVQRFVEEVGPQVVVGVYRASAQAPARLFYAHVDHAELAGLIALADGALQAFSGFPLLLDVAGLMCRSAFGAATLQPPVAAAYAAAGEPWRYARA